jgi:hypothetical protein
VSLVELTEGEWERGGGDGKGIAKSYFAKKAWSSINHSILSRGGVLKLKLYSLIFA